MNESTYIQVVGLGIGEETKASTVEFLAKELGAHSVLRSGGCQAGHHIVREDGTEHMFTHYGCGTLDGSRTLLSDMVINPIEIFREAMQLESMGIESPLDLIAISENCLAITPFHGALSRIKEIYRDEKKGTIGFGVGDAIKDYKEDSDFGITARDFFLPIEILIEKVELIRLRKLEQASHIVANSPWWDYLDGAEKDFHLLESQELSRETAESFSLLKDLVEIVEGSTIKKYLKEKGVIIGEPSHGALLHPQKGFVPHTTQIDPTAENVLRDIERLPISILKIGVSRCYMTRHGAGPLVSFSRELTSSITETHNNTDIANDWLGEFRNGHYDLLAIQYALSISGGADSFDGLAISYLDVLDGRESWEVCEGYVVDGVPQHELLSFFEIDSGGVIRGIKSKTFKLESDKIAHQSRLTAILKQCRPVLSTIIPKEKDSLEDEFIKYVEEKIGLPVVITAHGPKASDRKFRSDVFNYLEG